MAAPPAESPHAWRVGPRPGLTGALADTAALLLTALRLLLRHWPGLLALFLAGVLAHELAMQAAVKVSLVNAELGMLVLLLAPLSFLVALVLMLRVLRPSLPWLGRAGSERPPSVIKYLGVMLLPFMTIYYFENYLYEDINNYERRLVDDQFARDLAAITEDVTEVAFADRVVDPLTLSLLAVVAVAFVARRLLSRWHGPDRRAWLGIPGAYLELVWFSLVYLAFLQVAEQIVTWGGNRRLVHVVQDTWTQAMGSASGLSTPLAVVPGWIADHFGSVNAVLVIPLAWLALAAIVLGHEPPPARPSRLVDRLQRAWSAVPRPVTWAADKVTSDLRGWFSPLAQGVRMLVRAGVVPMLLFCLVFVAVRAAADWLWELQRLLIGPQDFGSVWLPVAGPLLILNRTVEYTLLACLLAAGVDRAARSSAPVELPQAPVAPTTSRA